MAKTSLETRSDSGADNYFYAYRPRYGADTDKIITNQTDASKHRDRIAGKSGKQEYGSGQRENFRRAGAANKRVPV